MDRVASLSGNGEFRRIAELHDDAALGEHIGGHITFWHHRAGDISTDHGRSIVQADTACRGRGITGIGEADIAAGDHFDQSTTGIERCTDVTSA